MGGKGSTTNTVAEPWKEAQPFLKDLLGGARSAYGSGEFDIAGYSGNRVAPQSDLTTGALDRYRALGASGNPITPAATSAFGRMVGGDDIYSDLAAVKQNALGSVIPAVSARFGQAGMLDSTLAADAISRAATEAVAPIDYGAWENSQNRALSALGMAPQLAANQYLDPQMLSLAGSQLDQYNQTLIQSEMDKYYEEANRPYDELQRAAGLALGFGGMGGTQQSKSKEGGNVVGDVMQVAGPLIAAFAMMSDRRLKTDVDRIGTTPEGFNLYRFRYIWDNPATRRVGVMAQEVPRHLRVMTPSGFWAVDYRGVTL